MIGEFALERIAFSAFPVTAVFVNGGDQLVRIIFIVIDLRRFEPYIIHPDLFRQNFHFVDLVLADPTLMAFFTSTDRPRFEACLVRQVCGIDGPCEYGLEVPAFQPELGGSVCRDMLSSHEGLTITIEDFTALVGHLVTAMTNYNVSPADQNAIGGVLGGLCSSIWYRCSRWPRPATICCTNGRSSGTFGSA